MDKTKGTRFKVDEFVNPSGAVVWRVAGYQRDGSRVRENFDRIEDARSRAAELEIGWLGGDVPAMPKVTRLTHDRLSVAERSFDRLGEDAPADELLKAVEFYLAAGRPEDTADVPRLDDAVAQFGSWLDQTSALRSRSKQSLKMIGGLLTRHLGNPHVNRVLPETIQAALETLGVSPTTRDNYRRGWSRFFSWCAERPRRWVPSNPVREVRLERGEASVPVILTVPQARLLMHAAETIADGRMATWFALGLFAGLRPSEASRVGWDQVNLTDGELRLEARQTKDGRSRVVSICRTLKVWLEAYRDQPVVFSRRHFRQAVEAAGLGEWKQDVLRHTAASHRLRDLGSYARVADEFGNSETMLKKHYAGRVSSTETKEFYSIRPAGNGVGK